MQPQLGAGKTGSRLIELLTEGSEGAGPMWRAEGLESYAQLRLGELDVA
jgi:hypothetical protein